MRSPRRLRYGRTAGPGSWSSRARRNGRYSRKPDSTKKTATPTSARRTRGPQKRALLKPAANATWQTSTPNAASARQPSRPGYWPCASRSGTAGTGAAGVVSESGGGPG